MAATESVDARARGAAAVTLVLCFLTATIEGIDLQSMGIAAPKLGPEFRLDPHQLGTVLTASPLGLFFGAFIGGRVADSFGRKGALILAMAVFGVFQLSTAWVAGFWPLVLIRFACGLGLGGALPNLIALTSEASGGKNDILNVVITAAGMPTGGALASYVAFLGGAHGDWRTVFYIGGVAPLLLAPVMAFILPESLAFTQARAAARQTGDRVNTLKALFGEDRTPTSLLLWIAFFGTTLVTYLLLNWLPVLMVAKGFSKPEASFIQIFFNIGSAAGSILLGWWMQRRPRRLILLVCYVGVAASLVGLMSVTKGVLVASVGEAVVGGFLLGAQYILYGLTPAYYRTVFRGTGTGAAVAAGRLGSAAGPQLGGLLLGAGRSTGEVLQALLPVTAVAAAAAILLMFRKRTSD